MAYQTLVPKLLLGNANFAQALLGHVVAGSSASTPATNQSFARVPRIEVCRCLLACGQVVGQGLGGGFIVAGDSAREQAVAHQFVMREAGAPVRYSRYFKAIDLKAPFSLE